MKHVMRFLIGLGVAAGCALLVGLVWSFCWLEQNYPHTFVTVCFAVFVYLAGFLVDKRKSWYL